MLCTVSLIQVEFRSGRNGSYEGFEINIICASSDGIDSSTCINDGRGQGATTLNRIKSVRMDAIHECGS